MLQVNTVGGSSGEWGGKFGTLFGKTDPLAGLPLSLIALGSACPGLILWEQAPLGTEADEPQGGGWE